MSEEIFVPLDGDADYRLGSGLLGASVPASAGPYALKEARLRTIERRIIRIEMALRRAGIEVEMIDPDMAVAQ